MGSMNRKNCFSGHLNIVSRQTGYVTLLTKAQQENKLEQAATYLKVNTPEITEINNI